MSSFFAYIVSKSFAIPLKFGNYKYWITSIPDLKILQANSRFQALLEKVNAHQVGSSM